MTDATTKTGDLADLLARVEKAEGPDRELDAEIEAAVFGGTASHLTGLSPHKHYDPGTVFTTVHSHAVLVGDTYHSTPLTASLDAALALVERCLPGFDADISARRGAPDAAYVWRSDTYIGGYGGEAASPALALIAALLKALIAQAAGSTGAELAPGTHNENPHQGDSCGNAR